MRRGHVVAVVALADAEQPALRRVGASRSSSANAAAFADREAAALRVPRPADVGRQQLERVEAVQRRQAQAVDAADDRRIDQARRRSGAPRCRTPSRSTSTRSRRPSSARAARARARTNAADRVGVLRLRVAEVGGQRAVGARAGGRRARSRAGPTVLVPRSTADALRAPALARRAHRVGEAVLLQAEPGEAVVAAVEVGEVGRQRRVVERRRPRRSRSAARHRESAPARGRCARPAARRAWPSRPAPSAVVSV